MKSHVISYSQAVKDMAPVTLTLGIRKDVRWSLRFAVARLLFRFAAWVLPMPATVSFDDEART